MNEKNILSNFDHKFIVNMISSFQDRNYLYLLIDLMIGGDLRFHICIKKKFSETEIKFFAGCIILAFEYFREKQIIHRDIKPENIVLNEKGYLKITDFGVSRYHSNDNSSETSGTPGYMSPEVLLRKNHSYEVDYFALGVILYECILGRRPYLGKNRSEIRNQILSFQAKIKKEDAPKFSNDCINFVNSLLQRKNKKRLGYKNIGEIKNHQWFSDFDWEKLKNKKMKAPFIPDVKIFFEYLKQLSEETDDETLYFNKKSNKNQNRLFSGYSYNNLIKIKENINDNKININYNKNKSIESLNKNKIKHNILISKKTKLKN